jgi:hypothetical protein
MFKTNLKSKLIVAVMVIIGITAFLSCQKEESNSELNNENKYSELALMLKNDLEDIGQNLREQKSTFSSQDIVISAAEQQFSDDPKAYDAFLIAYDKAINNSYLKSTVNNEVINTVIDEIEVGLINSSGSNEFINFLQSKFDEVSTSQMQIENKDFLLQYIVSYKISIEFINNNLDIIAYQNSQLKSTQGWWGSWGRCAAGIVGGAGLGALGGGAAGSVIPVLGTTAGLIVGGIAGGLSGAAASC